MGSQEIMNSPTDLMRRRTPLPFCRRFVWLGVSVTIRTNSPTVLNATEEAGFLPQSEVDRESDMQWEIVSEQSGQVPAGDWTCTATVDNHSLFLRMGAGQWFGFDLETGDGAGFVVVSDPDGAGNSNLAHYLFELTCNIGHCFALSGRGVTAHEGCSCT